MLTFHILNVYVDKTQPRQFKFTFNARSIKVNSNRDTGMPFDLMIRFFFIAGTWNELPHELDTEH